MFMKENLGWKKKANFITAVVLAIIISDSSVTKSFSIFMPSIKIVSLKLFFVV